MKEDNKTDWRRRVGGSGEGGNKKTKKSVETKQVRNDASRWKF